MHTLDVNGSGPELLFETRRWVGEPTNREPGKCSAVSWFSLDALPDYPGYRTGIPFSVHGWTPQSVPARAPS